MSYFSSLNTGTATSLRGVGMGASLPQPLTGEPVAPVALGERMARSVAEGEAAGPLSPLQATAERISTARAEIFRLRNVIRNSCSGFDLLSRRWAFGWMLRQAQHE